MLRRMVGASLENFGKHLPTKIGDFDLAANRGVHIERRLAIAPAGCRLNALRRDAHGHETESAKRPTRRETVHCASANEHNALRLALGAGKLAKQREL